MRLPTVTVVIPARNEESHIGVVLRGITESTYPPELIEVIVVDGMSTDRTRELVQCFATRFANVRLVDNPRQAVPFAMNVGIRSARGEIIVRMDAHAIYPINYVEQLVLWMQRLGADNVGAALVTRPSRPTHQAHAVAIILSHAFGVGSANFRIGNASDPIEVDTVPFGCYRREIFNRIGFYDEFFIRNQDDELNARLTLSGGRIFLIPQIQVEYFARESLAKMARMLYQYGFFKPAIAIKLGRPATLRQLAPPIFAASLLLTPLALVIAPALGAICVVSLLSHTIVNTCVSSVQAKRRSWQLLPFLIVGFFIAHVSYGVGYWHGLIEFGLMRGYSNLRRRSSAWLSR